MALTLTMTVAAQEAQNEVPQQSSEMISDDE